MTQKPSRFVIPTGTDLTLDPDVLPALRGRGFLSSKIPMWKSDIQESISGREYRSALWSYPRWKFAINHEWIDNVGTISDLQKFWAFYNSHLAGYKEFLYLDEEDSSVVDQPVAIGNGSTTTFQLTRTYGSPPISFTEPVRAFFGTPTIKLNGVVLSLSGYSLGEYGKVTFVTPPGSGVVITWSGVFFFVCRFQGDELSTSQMMSRLWSQDGLEYMSIKP